MAAIEVVAPSAWACADAEPMDLKDLASLVRLAASGSLSRTSRELGIDVSTLSRRLTRIEEDLGLSLFERGRGGLSLTKGGAELIRIVQRIIDDVEALRSGASQAGRAQTGRLKLATQLATIGPELRLWLQAYRKSHPGVRLELFEADDREILDALRHRQADAAVLFTPSVGPELGAVELWLEDLVLAVSDAHPLARADAVRWHDVRKEPVIVQGWANSQAYRDLEAGLIGSDADFRSHRAGCVELLALVAIGEGVMIVLASHRELEFPGITYIRIDEPNASVGISLAWSPSVEDPIAGSFVAFMRDRQIRLR